MMKAAPMSPMLQMLKTGLPKKKKKMPKEGSAAEEKGESKAVEAAEVKKMGRPY